ncbi:hypothetical protein ACELLULO517_14585 [Acidisoma cellulosilytica]|uniref:G8 domain-containing protein n=1 Tax=Acidisoma cellulosilyticum TaxID=2802395 RepID=A0A964E4H2_9PROT|nr:hypothetical protein [Acidisoma cellulosilyticum]MCB8881474.1 hypothetical protein [Acidisoma cellulosilyticum]
MFTGQAPRNRGLYGLALPFAICLGWLSMPAPARADDASTVSPPPIRCSDVLAPQALAISDPKVESGRIALDAQPDLLVESDCVVKPGSYYFGHVNIIKGGSLIFKENDVPGPNNQITFWARSILIENQGAMKAGVDGDKPFGERGGKLDIVLYGPDQVFQDGKIIPAQGAVCASAMSGPNGAPCGIPQDTWISNGDDPVSLPGGAKKDYFYRYGPLMFDGAKTSTGAQGYFGSKTLGLSYGGTLQLKGAEGTDLGKAIFMQPADYPDPAQNKDNYKLNSGTSWARLNGDVKAGDNELKLDRRVQNDWQVGDEIVLSTTDYVPDHSEDLIITGFKDDHTITVRQAPDETSSCRKPSGELTPAEQETCTTTGPLHWGHNGTQFDIATLLGAQGKSMTGGMDPALQQSAETRAAVALLSRSIVIESGGDRAGETFADATNGSDVKHVPKNPNYAMGAITTFRQGFESLGIDGVEFRNLGVGGRMDHYAVHFHEARNVPPDTYIRDSSVNDSMTRWFVLHDTNGVELSRNVGWKSIGHGFYLEDGTEADNDLYSNIGIFARAGVVSSDNPRNIPGILSQKSMEPSVRYRSDAVNPSIFWITNGWNELAGNMAVGAGTCGTCFWYVPSINSDRMDVPSTGASMLTNQKWEGYSAEQEPYPIGRAGAGSTPVKLFYKNYCSTAMAALNFTSDASPCDAMSNPLAGTPEAGKIAPIVNPLAASGVVDAANMAAAMYYPNILPGLVRIPTICDPNKPGSCATVDRCSNTDPKTCGITVADHFTTSFNWPQTNFAAVWMRGAWNIFDNSFISDVQNGGLTLVSGGDYSRSSVPLGYWALASHSVFAGFTQPQDGGAFDGPHEYALEQGPCAALNCDRRYGNVRIAQNQGIAFALSDWATNQRLFSIYDGPAYEDANAFLNVKSVGCDNAETCMYWGKPGVRRLDASASGIDDAGYLPNAAIGWKQPNGFYYPPAFGSRNLFFDNVDIRHFVTTPITKRGTYLTDAAEAQKQLVGSGIVPTNAFTNYTDVDRQTVLNDEDGSLTGFVKTVSVNDDFSSIETVGGKSVLNKPLGGFFGAPIQAEECESSTGVNPDNACANQVPQTPPSTRTSPYEYVTTVVYPECAKQGTKDDACGSMTGDDNRNPIPEEKEVTSPRRMINENQRGGDWSKDCAGPFCTGVKLYRQDLTTEEAAQAGVATYPREWQQWADNGCDDQAAIAKAVQLMAQRTVLRAEGKTLPPDEAAAAEQAAEELEKCNFPFIRMAGASEWQRSSLTVNGGTYYLDTTTSQNEQRSTNALGAPTDTNINYVDCAYRQGNLKTLNCEPRSVNVFKGGETYDVLFLFVTPTIEQTYQIYVGDGFNKDTDIHGVQVPDSNQHFKIDPWSAMPKSWIENAKMISSDPKEEPARKDVLQITVNFSEVEGLNPKDSKVIDSGETCQPHSFCEPDGTSPSGCGCNIKALEEQPWQSLSPTLKASCQNACETWAVHDLDYPKSGILGFSFTLPKTFTAEDQYRRPQPAPAAIDAAPWNVELTSPKDEALAGVCYHAPNQTPGKGSCGVPN